MKHFTKNKILPFLLAAFMVLCAFFGVILTMPLAKADDSAAEPPDFSTWFAEPLEVDDVVAEQYIRVNNVSEVPEDVHLWMGNNAAISISRNSAIVITPDDPGQILPVVATYENSFVFYVEPFSKTWPEFDNLVISISEGDLLGLDSGNPYPEGFLEHFELLSEPPVSGLASKTLEVGDDLAGKWVYMPNGAMADVYLSKTFPIEQGEDGPVEVDFFLVFYGNPGDDPNQAEDGCPCSWGFAELGIEVLTDGNKAYYKIPETFTLTHGNEFAINETEEFVAGDLVVKRIDSPEDGPQLMLFYEAPVVDDETPDNTEKEDKPVIDLDAIGEWFNGIGADVSEWLSDNNIIKISASGVLVVGFAIIVIVGLIRKRKK